MPLVAAPVQAKHLGQHHGDDDDLVGEDLLSLLNGHHHHQQHQYRHQARPSPTTSPP